MDSNLLNDVNSWKEVVRPTKKPRSVGKHKSKPKKTTSEKKTNQKNKKSRSVTRSMKYKHLNLKNQGVERTPTRHNA